MLNREVSTTCPLAATKKTWPSQSVAGFASRRTAVARHPAEYAQLSSRAALLGDSAPIV
jgi:hypothetical protein